MRRALAAALIVIGVGCGSTPPIVAPQVPKYEPDQQAKSRVRADPLKPLIIEWPAAARSQLETTSRGGVVAVRYDGQTMEVLEGCRPTGQYAYVGGNLHRDRLVITNEEELAAHLPLGVASLSGKLARAGRLDVDLAVVGAYTVGASEVELPDDEACDGATHYVSSLSAGAFQIESGGAASGAVAAGAYGVGAEAKSSATKEVLASAGDIGACAVSMSADTEAPVDCGALIRVVLVKVPRKETPPIVSLAPGPDEPSGEPVDEPIASAEPTLGPVIDPGPSESGVQHAPASDGSGWSSLPEADRGSDYTWLAVGTAAVIVGGLIAVGVVVSATRDEVPRGDPPSGGLGSVTLGRGLGDGGWGFSF